MAQASDPSSLQTPQPTRLAACPAISSLPRRREPSRRRASGSWVPACAGTMLCVLRMKPTAQAYGLSPLQTPARIPLRFFRATKIFLFL